MNILKFWVRKPKDGNGHQGSNLQKRFIWRVLAPPFFILLVLGIVIFWQLDKFVRKQAVDELSRAASTTAVKLEREFAIRQTVLRRTGEELFIIKSTYQTNKTTLDKNRADCSAHLKAKKPFQTAPNGACEPFLADFARQGTNLQAVEDGYVRSGVELIKTQDQSINSHLSAYKQFFPETMALIVVDADKQLVSSALSEEFDGSTSELEARATKTEKESIEGQILELSDKRLAIFAYPIEGGSVVAAYDLSSDSFVRETWESTPIDRTQALAVILDSGGHPSYPVLPFSNTLKDAQPALRQKPYEDVVLKDINHIAVGSEVGSSKWLVVVASPAAAVLAPLRDAQLLAVIIIGTLLVGFLWVGAFFIQKTLRSILRLVSGALVFSSGNLNYKIQLPDADIEFVSLAQTMNGMAERIAAAEKEIDEKNKEFISIATHELRTPLTAIKGNLSMVYEDLGSLLPDQLKPLVEQAYTGTTRLATLVNDMLDMARLDGNRVEFVIEPQDMQAVANDVVETLRVTANEKSISLLHEPGGAGKVLADATKLRIVLNNFVSNAIKYNRPNGSVRVTHSLKDGKLVTAIADTGLGIPEDQKAHMFEKFFRVQNADRKDVVGTGLGMYITREYIIKMGGQVWFESTHGQGTTFYFTLPLATQLAQAPTAESHDVVAEHAAL